MLKLILINILAFLYAAVARFILCIAILWPFAYGHNESLQWTGWVIYPLALIVGVTQGLFINYFNSKLL